MKTKEFLRTIRKTQFVIKSRRLSLDRMRSLLEYTTTNISDMPSSNSDPSKRRTEQLNRFLVFQEDYESLINSYMDRIKRAEDMIDSLPDATMMEICYKRYFDGCTWDEISYELNISNSWMYELHGKALQFMDRKFGEIYV